MYAQSYMEAAYMARSANTPIKLDPTRKSDAVANFEKELANKIIGQPQALQCLVRAYQTFISGLSPINRPVAVLLFAGGTGTGKTKCVEAAAEVILGSSQALTKIDCAEYHLQHDTAKLTGSPAGYLGHRETQALLSQRNIDKYQTAKSKLNFVLFDEIEKAHDAFWQLLLGIMDKGKLTVGDNTTTDFKDSIIVLTTNLGAGEMDKLLSGSFIGFQQQELKPGSLEDTAKNAIRKHFTPEFINRIDHTVVFNTLEHQHYVQIASLELQAVQARITSATTGTVPLFILRWTPNAIEFLLERGIDPRYGARELKRTIEQHIVLPLANLVATHQIRDAETILIDSTGTELQFFREPIKITA